MKIRSIMAILVLTVFVGTVQVKAQCKIRNDYFQAGEEMIYDLYAKLGPFHSKAGVSSLKTSSEVYDGVEAYRVALIAESTGTIRKLFSLNDTLVGYITKDVVPLAYIKDAHEGKDDTHEYIKYKYNANNDIDVNVKRVKNGTERFNENVKVSNCIYDMVSVVMYARTLDYSSMKKGDEMAVEFMSGRNRVKMIIEHDGEEKMKGNDKKTYDCIKLILSISDDAFTDKEEAMKVYITNDKNRMPVRLDSQLKIGSTRAILKSYKGNKYPIGQQ